MANCEYCTKNNDCPGLNFCAHKGEDAAKKILELEQRVKVLTNGLRALNYTASENSPNACIVRELLRQTPQQTAAQIERGHIEWMMKLPVAFRVFECCGVLSEKSHSVGSRVVDLYKIPPLPKESKE